MGRHYQNFATMKFVIFMVNKNTVPTLPDWSFSFPCMLNTGISDKSFGGFDSVIIVFFQSCRMCCH